MIQKLFTYYGAKFNIASQYPGPIFDLIIEPFAGSAGYSLLHGDRCRVELSDADPKIAGIWTYLIAATPEEIMRLPAEVPAGGTGDMAIPQEAKWLIGYWLNTPSARPVTNPSPHMRSAPKDSTSFWGPTVRQIIANNVMKIKHWKIRMASWEVLQNDNRQATWYIDPPYQNSVGRAYDTNLDAADFTRLAVFCRARRGQVIVCEQEGATWLPFRFLGTFGVGAYAKKAGRHKAEVIWTK